MRKPKLTQNDAFIEDGRIWTVSLDAARAFDTFWRDPYNKSAVSFLNKVNDTDREKNVSKADIKALQKEVVRCVIEYYNLFLRGEN